MLDIKLSSGPDTGSAAGLMTSGVPLGAPVAACEFDPLSVEVRRCPHRYYEALNRQPVLPLSGHPNFYVVSDYEIVSEVLMDPETYDGQPFPGHEVPIMSAMRPEPHQRLRSAIQTLFTNKAVEGLKPFIESSVQRRTNALLANGGGDLMALWANPIPLSVIARMFGFPGNDSDLARLHRYGDAAVRLVIPVGGPGLPMPHGWGARWRILKGLLSAAVPAIRLMLRLPADERRHMFDSPNPFADLPGYPRTGFPHRPDLIRLIFDFELEVLELFQRRMAKPGDEVIDALVPEYQAGRLNLREVLSSAVQILVAGYETTASTLGHAVYRLAETPGLHDELRNEPDKIEAFIEELLRLDAPLQRTLRRTTRPVRLGGVDLPENAQLIIMLGAANLDSRRFEQPLSFDPSRPNMRRHLAFGRGIHMCIGAQLARLEARLALTQLIARTDTIRLVANDPPVRLTDKDVGMWGFVRLPVSVQASR